MSEGNGLPRTFVVGNEDYRRLSFRDMIDASEAAGVDSLDVEHLKGVAQIRVLAALAWVVLRRTEPDLTYDAVLDGRVQKPEEEASPLGASTRTS